MVLVKLCSTIASSTKILLPQVLVQLVDRLTIVYYSGMLLIMGGGLRRHTEFMCINKQFGS